MNYIVKFYVHRLALFLLSLGYSKIMQAVLSHVLYLHIESVWNWFLSIIIIIIIIIIIGRLKLVSCCLF